MVWSLVAKSGQRDMKLHLSGGKRAQTSVKGSASPVELLWVRGHVQYRGGDTALPVQYLYIFVRSVYIPAFTYGCE